MNLGKADAPNFRLQIPEHDRKERATKRRAYSNNSQRRPPPPQKPMRDDGKTGSEQNSACKLRPTR